MTSMAPLHVVLIDPDPRRRAEATYELAAASIIVEPCDTIAELSQVSTVAEGIVIYDFQSSISQLIDHLVDRGMWRPVIGCAEHPTVNQVVKAMQDGADSYLAWPLSPSAIRRTLHRIANSPSSPGKTKALQRKAQRRIERLTRRQRDVLALIAQGATSREIGERLGLSHRTVEIHRAAMIKRLETDSTTQALFVAFESGLDEFKAAAAAADASAPMVNAGLWDEG